MIRGTRRFSWQWSDGHVGRALRCVMLCPFTPDTPWDQAPSSGGFVPLGTISVVPKPFRPFPLLVCCPSSAVPHVLSSQQGLSEGGQARGVFQNSNQDCTQAELPLLRWTSALGALLRLSADAEPSCRAWGRLGLSPLSPGTWLQVPGCHLGTLAPQGQATAVIAVALMVLCRLIFPLGPGEMLVPSRCWSWPPAGQCAAQPCQG